MILGKVFERFVERSPVSVMFRGAMENVCSPERLDRLFADRAKRQHAGLLLFSTVADLLSQVVCQLHKSVHSAYKEREQEIGVSVKSVYDKLAGVEPAVCEALVSDLATHLSAVHRELKAAPTTLLPGYEVRIADGNHLAGTEHRLKPLRGSGAAALPGQALAILDPQSELICDMIACPDGHANERTLLPQLLEKVAARQVWIADRNFCTLDFMLGIIQRQAFFAIRQHLGAARWKLVGERRELGRIAGGAVYEETVQLTSKASGGLVLRRIVIQLDKPTRDGDREVYIFSNLPADVDGKAIAELYRSRWTIETAFQHLATSLRSEVNTLGYPEAALFGFALAVVAYNLLATVKVALRTAHDLPAPPRGEAGLRVKSKKISTYYLADAISGISRGMEIAIPAQHWTAAFAHLTPGQLAATLLELAKKVRISRFLANPYSPKRPQPKRKSGNRGNHVSTHRLLQKTRKASPC